MINEQAKRAYTVLASSTISFTACFTIWLMFSVVGVPIKQNLGLSETEFGMLTAMPILAGSLIRIPLGVLTDRFGGRIVMFILMILCVPAVWYISEATKFWHFLIIGFLMGCAGGTFSVGTPYVSHWFPKEQKGFAMGIFGAGNSGAAVNKFLAPAIILAFGWQMVPKAYAVGLFFIALNFWFFSYTDTKHLVTAKGKSVAGLMEALKDCRVWKYSLYYFLVFGGYVGFALWIVHLYQREFGVSLASAALLGACFSLPGGLLRIFGGWLSDFYGAYKVTLGVFLLSLVALALLSIPNAFGIEIFTILVFTLGIGFAFGKASVFKYIGDDYLENIGSVSGIVGLAGGMGGFVFPIVFGWVLDITNVNSTCFMILLAVLVLCMVWMYFSEYVTGDYKKYEGTHSLVKIN